MKRKFICAIIISLLVAGSSFFSQSALAAPAYNKPVKMVQPSGEVFYGTSYGDEKNNWVVSADNCVIVKGNDGYWYYAKQFLGSIRKGDSRFLLDSKPENAVSTEAAAHGSKIQSFLSAPFSSSQNTVSSTEKIQSLANTTQNMLVFLVEFNDMNIKNSEVDWYNEFFNFSSNSVNSYYNEVSQGKFSFTPAQESYNNLNDGIIKVKLNYNHPNTSNSVNGSNEKIVRDALIAADPYINYASFDKNQDGYLSADELHIVTIAAGYEASYSSNYSPSLWAHRASLSWYNAIKLDNTSLCDASHNGGYTQTGEMHDDHVATIGPICHEIGHDLGLPDLYDTDNSSEGIGIHSLMASGSWTYSGGYPGSMPSHLDPWSKMYLGFVDPLVVNAGGRYSVNQSGSSNYNILKIPTSSPYEYFLVENRQFNGYDKGLTGFISRGGVAIWHIDEKTISDNFQSNTVNDKEEHKGVDLEEANEGILGYSQLDTSSGRIYSHYFYNGYNNLFSNTTKPGSLLYNGTDSRVNISIPSVSASVMNIDIVFNEGLKINTSIPANNQNSIPISQNISIVFDKLIEKGVNIDNISLKDQFGNIVQKNLNVDKNTLIIDPQNDLNYNSSYSLAIPPGAVISVDRSGINDNYSISFTTELDKLPLKIISNNVTSDSVDINKKIQITFNKAIQKNSGFSGIILKDKNGKIIQADVRVYNNILEVSPYNFLDYDMRFTLTIPKDSLKDMSGNSLELDELILFKTLVNPSGISRIAGINRYETSASISSYFWEMSSNSAVLATGENFADALSAGPLAKKYNAPILLTETNNLSPYAESEIERLKVKTIYIVGGEGAVSKDIENRLISKGISCIRLKGRDRFETSLEVAKYIGTDNGIFIANGYNYPDALSISSYAAYRGIPIILSDDRELPLSIKSFITANVKKTYVIGGEGVISNNVFNSLPNPERIAGRDRYETNIESIKRFSNEYDMNRMFVASGEGFADALSGTSAAGSYGAPIFLVSKATQDLSSVTVSYVKGINGINSRKYVLGGIGVVPDDVINILFR